MTGTPSGKPEALANPTGVANDDGGFGQLDRVIEFLCRPPAVEGCGNASSSGGGEEGDDPLGTVGREDRDPVALRRRRRRSAAGRWPRLGP